jgi:hypothetical protein
MNRSTPTGAPSSSIPFCGRIVGSGSGVVPNASRIAACAISSTIAYRGYVLSHGELAASGTAKSLSSDSALLAASYLGGSAA